LGLIYAKAGKPEKARTTLSQALKLKADVEGAAEARAVLASLRN
jgi:Flp pilus assembly protein TadD